MATDFALDNRVLLDNSLDCAIQELDMLFNTTNTELIGNAAFGTNFEQFLWEIAPSTEELEKYIYEKIGKTYFLSQYDVGVSIRTELGTTRDIYYVEISLKTNSDDEEIQHKSRRVYMLT